MRFHEAAVIDANHLIKIMSALLHTTSSGNQDESMATEGSALLMISKSDSTRSLNSMEREILEDNKISVTSSILFQKVRVDAARAIARRPIKTQLITSRSSINDIGVDFDGTSNDSQNFDG